MTPLRTTFALAFCMTLAGQAFAQPQQSGLATLIASGTTVEGGASLAITGGVGYRFNQVVGVSMELTTVPSFTPDTPAPPGVPVPLSTIGGIAIPLPTYDFRNEDGRATIFTANLRLEMPVASRRLLPYIVGGAGVANVREEFTVTIVYPPPILASSPGYVATTIFRPPVSIDVSSTSTDMAATLGGGLSVLAAEHFSVDVDLRYLAVLGARDLHFGRYGLGVTYRF